MKIFIYYVYMLNYDYINHVKYILCYKVHKLMYLILYKLQISMKISHCDKVYF